MSWIDEIRNFLEDYSGVYPERPETDIYGEMGVAGDDFHEMIEKYSENYGVDMSSYLWYFHADEEGFMSFGSLFFKPPYARVERIPVTPALLAKFVESKKWDVDYPEHSIPKKRTDILINKIFGLVVGIFVLYFAIKSWLK